MSRFTTEGVPIKFWLYYLGKRVVCIPLNRSRKESGVFLPLSKIAEYSYFAY